MDDIHNNLKNERNKEERKEKRLLDEGKSLETEIDDLKRVNEKKEMQLIELIRENIEKNEKNEALKIVNSEHFKNEVHEKEQRTQSSLAYELNLWDMVHLDVEKLGVALSNELFLSFLAFSGCYFVCFKLGFKREKIRNISGLYIILSKLL